MSFFLPLCKINVCNVTSQWPQSQLNRDAFVKESRCSGFAKIQLPTNILSSLKNLKLSKKMWFWRAAIVRPHLCKRLLLASQGKIIKISTNAWLLTAVEKVIIHHDDFTTPEEEPLWTHKYQRKTTAMTAPNTARRSHSVSRVKDSASLKALSYRLRKKTLSREKYLLSSSWNRFTKLEMNFNWLGNNINIF